ncbi:MAG: phospho-N-acetylmuramoyl-pentapeptide-transferase [Planctomycetota bacterium]
MFYWLFHQCLGINLFRYVTFRLCLSAMTGFLVAVLLGPRVIRFLRKRSIGENTDKAPTQEVRNILGTKKGTPTMGGVLILLGILAGTLLWARLTAPSLLLAVFVTVSLAAVGFVDDCVKLFSATRNGVRGRTKLAAQTGIALIAAALLFRVMAGVEHGTDLAFPVFKDLYVPLGLLFLATTTIVVVGSSNAVNLTDGLDGLAAGTVAMAGFGFIALSYVTGHKVIAEYLLIPHIPGAEELSVFCASLVGATLGFLWFNCYPAEIFMGDTGALSLGGALGFVSVAIKQEFALFIVGGIFVAEALSVMAQVASFKLTGKRVLLMSPLHLHFRTAGMNEVKVVVRFCIVGGMLAIVSLLLLKIR